MTDHIPPQDLTAEQATLGACILSDEARQIVTEIVHPRDFYRDAHKSIFQVILDLEHAGEPVDILTLRAKGCDGLYLVELLDSIPATANAGYYAGLVRDCATRRRMIDAAIRITAMANDSERDLSNIIGDAGSALQDACDHHQQRQTEPLNDVLNELYDELEARTEAGVIKEGISTGIDALTRMTGGWQQNDLIILAARPSIGKTALAVNRFALAAIKAQKRVVVFSLEMGTRALLLRLVAAWKRIPLYRLLREPLSRDDFKLFGECCATLTQRTDLLIDDTTGLSVTDMRNRLHAIQRTHGKVDLVIVDYLTLLKSERSRERNDQEVGESAKALKGIAKEFQLPVICLSQLNRQAASEGQKPDLKSLRESGNIEEHADIVMFLWREKEQDEELKRTWLSIVKHRNGETRDVPLMFDSSIVRFDQITADSDTPPPRSSTRTTPQSWYQDR